MDLEHKIATTSAIVYSGISIGTSLLFLFVASLSGDYTEVARFGGAVWVLLLSFIVTMPLVTSAVKRRLKAS